MKKQLFLLLSLPFFCFCQTAAIKNDLQKESLKGNVKQVKQNNYFVLEKFGEVVQGSKKITEKDNYLKLYNEKGNKAEWFIYVMGTERYQKHVYKYIDSLSRIDEDLYRPDGSLDWKYIYKYDEKNNLIEENWYNADGRLCKRGKFKYDTKFNKTEANYYDGDGNLNCKYIYKYDDKGNQVEENMYNASDKLNWKHIYKYDDKGNLSENYEYKPDGKLKWGVVSKFDEMGNPTEKNTYKANGSMDSRRISSYEYDKFGNWIKKISKEDTDYTMTIREIEYY